MKSEKSRSLFVRNLVGISIKLLGERTPGSYEQMHDVIVHRMARDERADAGRKMFVEKLKEDKYFASDESVRAMLEKEISDTSFMTCLANMGSNLVYFSTENLIPSRV